jgi:formylglycine-generating enzyme required for sulfatase activity
MGFAPHGGAIVANLLSLGTARAALRTALLLLVAILGNTANAVSIDLVPVGNPGNGPNTQYKQTTDGAVDYGYSIGKFEITVGQYTEFLNAVAGNDTYGLYNSNMSDPSVAKGCNIQRSGTPGNYTYSVASDWANRPVNWVSWGDAARFSNWLTNGQPTGVQGVLTTEDGSYCLNGATSDAALIAVTRKADARYVVPTRNEWYKAAYHKNNGVTDDYWDFPTGTDAIPSNVLSSTGTNNANFLVRSGGQSFYTLGDPYWRTEVGAFAGSPSPYGTYDQGGNVWEWAETGLPELPDRRGMEGGSFDSGGLGSSSGMNVQSSPEYENLGFRIAYVPEPTMFILVALAAAVVLQRRY